MTQHTAQSVTLCSAGRELEACPAPDRPPLWGIPFAVKDNIDVAGFKTTAACKDFAYMPEKSAAAVQALLQAGDKHCRAVIYSEAYIVWKLTAKSLLNLSVGLCCEPVAEV